MAESHRATIRLGCQVVDLDPETGVIEFKDGSKIQKDLVVVADGQHDRLNARVTGKDVPMQRSGQTAYRCLIPMADILSDPVTAPLFENQAPGFWAPALPPKGVMAVTYPCRKNTLLNVLLVHRKLGQHASSEEDATIEDWNFPATHEDLERVLDGFHDTVKRVFMKSPEVKVYTQMKRQPLSCMTKGKAVLIGDASHPMLLTHAQGVSSSFEDAAALEVFLADVPTSFSITSQPSQRLLQRLQQFEKFRLPRVSATQILTDPVVPGPKAAENYKKQEEEIRKYYDGLLPPTGAMPHSPPICQFFFGYDVQKDALSYMEEHPLPLLSAPTPSLIAQSPAASRQPSPSHVASLEVYNEAQKALAAAQLALVQVTQTLAAAQKALDLATRNLFSNGVISAPPVPQETQSEQNLIPSISQAPKAPPKPKRLKSFENLRNKMSTVFSSNPGQVTVRTAEVTPPATPPLSQMHNASTYSVATRG